MFPIRFNRRGFGLVSCLLISLAPRVSYACDKAQMIDYDYSAKKLMAGGYSTFGRVWSLDNQSVCIHPLRYKACFVIEPQGKQARVTTQVFSSKKESFSHTQLIPYNQSEVIKFHHNAIDVYVKLFVSNTAADHYLRGRKCSNNFPNIPRQVTREELDNMYRG